MLPFLIFFFQTLLAQSPAGRMRIAKASPLITEIGTISHTRITPQVRAHIFAAVFVRKAELSRNFFFGKRTERAQYGFLAFGVKENGVGIVSSSLRQMLRSFLSGGDAFPSDFVAEVFLAEDSVHQQAKVVIRIRIAVQVNASCGFEKVS